MPVSMEIILELPENEKVHRAMGSILQGALMEIIGVETSKKLHGEGLRPYSQFVYFDKNRNLPIWRVNVLNDWAREKILVPLTPQRQIFLRHKNYRVNLLQHKIISEESYENLAEHFMSNNVPISKGIEIDFITTASFRRDGRYVIFPEIYLILQSLLNRWNNFSTAFTVEGEELPRVLSNFLNVKEYNFYSQVFLLEHQKFNGFCGRMTANFEGDATTNKLLGLLFEYANYCGIGIKTALGMGAVKTKLNFNQFP